MKEQNTADAGNAKQAAVKEREIKLIFKVDDPKNRYCSSLCHN